MFLSELTPPLAFPSCLHVFQLSHLLHRTIVQPSTPSIPLNYITQPAECDEAFSQWVPSGCIVSSPVPIPPSVLSYYYFLPSFLPGFLHNEPHD